MKTLVLVLTAAAALCACPAFAEEIATPTPPLESASAAPAVPATEAAQTPAPRTGPPNLCSKEDPYIEYRDCVNASTRDQNAKVRDA